MDSRRATLAGVPVKRSAAGMPPARVSLAVSAVREDGERKRDVRNKTHQTECLFTLLDFLSARGYEKPFNPERAAGVGPTLKEFQEVFRFLAGFVDPSIEFGKRFEDEVVIFLRGLRYPYASEINRSQMLSVTQRTWPVLLSMLSWLAELVVAMECTDRCAPCVDECNRIFYEYVHKSYCSFMENIDDTDDVHAELERALEDLTQERQKALDERSECLQQIEEEIAHLEREAGSISALEEKKKQVKADIAKILSFRKHLEAKMKSQAKSLEESKRALEEVREEAKGLEEERQRLEGEVGLQQIRPEDVEEMNNERDRLIRTLEEIRMRRGEAIRHVQEKEAGMREAVEQLEKLIFDINRIRGSMSVEVFVERRRGEGVFMESEEYLFHGNLHAVAERLAVLSTETEKRRRLLEEELNAVYEQNAHLIETKNHLLGEIGACEDKAKIYAQTYVEKKEAFEAEQKRNAGKLERMESDLLKMKADAGNALFSSEQAIERLAIQKEALLSKISAEGAEAEKISFLLEANIRNCRNKCVSMVGACFSAQE
jgi:kinetochore protein NDC80